ncbi:DUF2202 domain-containing protein [Azohydromonas sediminis]|uniref:DUF2202 domain-containing protein n=1 Tax=Azohydromonas sediminis TaxID=2259674 RepID=UPI000E653CE7|nr:DUF2202 domain-containing protein [Azohydromonas sediminis]
MRRKQFLRVLGAVIGVAAAGPLLTACGGGDDIDATTATISSVTRTLSDEEIEGLKFMREEEKLAHDVYVTLFARWGATVFANIAESETEHTSAILDLLLKHGIEDPAAGNPVGVFDNDDLQALYDQLVAAGQASLVDALKVGALIEEKDIQDINDKLAATDETDIAQVYGHLLCGSRNHLRSFNQALLDQGVTYVPTVITQQEWDAIASSAYETCGG